MFIHNLKYTIKSLLKNRTLIFWTFAFSIILSTFFYMAFSNIENDEKLQIFDIAVIDNESFENQEIYKETLKKLSEESDDKLFNIKYVNKEEAEDLLENSEIEGYILFENETPKIVVKTTGTNQTIIKFVVDEIEQTKTVVRDLIEQDIKKEIENGNINFNTENIVNNILDKINNEKVELKNISNSNLSYMMIEYYTVIAMACMYGGMIGITAINGCLANMSNRGKRIAVSPTRKSVIVLSSAIGAYFVSLIGVALLIIFLVLALKVNFGTNLGLVILLAMIGNLAGTSLGVLIASCFKVSEGTKTGITISVSMILSVLSGMMGVTLKYLIDKNAPIINRMNPNNLITDGFYSLYYYNTLDRYWSDILNLLIFSIICLVISFISLRREKYDSI